MSWSGYIEFMRGNWMMVMADAWVSLIGFLALVGLVFIIALFMAVCATIIID